MAPTAAAHAAAASPPPSCPGPVLTRPDLAAVKVLMFPCVAGLWVGGACAAAAAMAYAAFPSWEGPPMILALVMASLGGILFSALLANVVFLLLLRVAVRDSDSIQQACGPYLRSLLRDTTWLSYFTALVFDVLTIFFLAVELSMESQVSRIGTLAIDMGAVISAAISCVDILPSMALKLWRMKPSGGTAADGCVV